MFTKKNTLLVLFILGCFSINAQEQDPKAKKVLDELSAKTKAYSTIKAEFTWVVEKKDKTKDTQIGKIQTKGPKYKLEIPGHDIYCDGKTVWDFIKDANEVQIKDMEVGGDDAVNPSTIFTIYEKGYKYKFVSEDATSQMLELYPINPDKKKFHTIKLVLDKTKKQISSVKMMMKDGTVQTYTIKSFAGGTVIPDTDFAFDAKLHKGVSVEDIR
jgi:outer membrane lipoprotein-sorting protein